MSDPALDVVEFVLTTHLYTENRDLDENDLPPRFRQVFWSDDAADDAPGGVERPLKATSETTRTATGVEHPWDAVSDLLFTQRTEFSGEISLTQPAMALGVVSRPRRRRANRRQSDGRRRAGGV